MAQLVFSPTPLEIEFNGQFFTLVAGSNTLPDDAAAFAVAKFRERGLTYGSSTENSEGN